MWSILRTPQALPGIEIGCDGRALAVHVVNMAVKSLKQ